jgi:hypothetical protein
VAAVVESACVAAFAAVVEAEAQTAADFHETGIDLAVVVALAAEFAGSHGMEIDSVGAAAFAVVAAAWAAFAAQTAADFHETEIDPVVVVAPEEEFAGSHGMEIDSVGAAAFAVVAAAAWAAFAAQAAADSHETGIDLVVVVALAADSSSPAGIEAVAPAAAEFVPGGVAAPFAVQAVRVAVAAVARAAR